MQITIDHEEIDERKLDSKGRISLREYADPGDTVEFVVLEVKRVRSDE